MIDLGSMYTRIQADTSQLHKAESDIKSFAGRAATLFASIYSVQQAANFVKTVTFATARFDTMGIVMNRVGNNAGFSTSQMEKYEMALRKTGISMTAARETMSRMALAQIDLTKSTELATIAQGAAIIADINSSEAFERMIHGIQSGETEVLKTIGINVDFQASYKKLADQLGVNVKLLTQQEKVQARTNAVLAQTPKFLGIYSDAMDSPMKKFNTLTGRLIPDFEVALGRLFQPAFGTAVDVATAKLKEFQAQLDDKTLKEWGENINIAVKFVAEYGGSIVELTGFLLAAKGAQLLLNAAVSANPYVMAAGALVILNKELETYNMNLGSLPKSYNAFVQSLNAMITGRKQFYDPKTGKITLEVLSEEEKGMRRIAQLQKELSEGKKWYDGGLLGKSQRFDKIKKEIKEIQEALEEAPGNKRLEEALKAAEERAKIIKPVPEERPKDEDAKGRAENWNAVLNAQIAYLNAAEERKMATILASNALEQEANQSNYDLGLSDYSTYLEKKQELTESALQTNLEAKQRELATAEAALGKLTPSVGKEGQPRADKDAQAEFQAMQRIEEAKRGVIEAENDLAKARNQGLVETIQGNKEVKNSYKQIEIQLLQMQGKPIEAAKLQAQMDEESIERRRLIEAAINKVSGAQEALDNLRKQSAIEIRNLELDELTKKGQAQQGIADINNEFQKSREIQIQLLDIEIKRAELNGDLKEQIDLLKEQKEALEDLQTPLGAFTKGWEDATASWRDQSQIMQDVAKETAQAMQSSFTDFFFDLLEGKLKTLGDYARSFLRAINQEIASTLAKMVVGNMGSGSGSITSGIIGGILGIFGAVSGSGSTSTASTSTASTSSSGAGLANTSSMNWGGRHSGGLVGTDKPTFQRELPPGSHLGVPRLHEGLQMGEFKTILKRDEMVLTKQQQDTLVEQFNQFRRLFDPSKEGNQQSFEAPKQSDWGKSKVDDQQQSFENSKRERILLDGSQQKDLINLLIRYRRPWSNEEDKQKLLEALNNLENNKKEVQPGIENQLPFRAINRLEPDTNSDQGKSKIENRRLFETFSRLEPDARSERRQSKGDISVNVPINIQGNQEVSRQLSADLKRKIERVVVETLKEHS